MKTIKEILDKHVDCHAPFGISINDDAIAHEICEEIEKLFLNDERCKLLHEIPPLCWKEFKKINGVVLISNSPFKQANGIEE